MTTQPESSVPNESPRSLASESLSQFVARVLNQLSLVAWLPAGTLVLALTFVFELNAALSGKPHLKGASGVINHTFEALTNISVGGALLLFAAVIVLTTLTQVFAFDAIHILQGYWGTLRIIEWVAGFRCMHFRNQCDSLEKRNARLAKEIWAACRAGIQTLQAQPTDCHDSIAKEPRWTDDMILYLGGIVTGKKTGVKLTPAQREQALRIPWRHFVPRDLPRRALNLYKRLQDFPERESNFMPTKLGNVLRAYWDQVREEVYGDPWGEASVDTFVLDNYERLPSYLREQHREWRDRLDLYCSMVFVVGMVTVLSAAVLGLHHWRYGIVAIFVGVVAMWVAYRAAVTTARYYGRLELSMARYLLPKGEVKTGLRNPPQ